MLIFILAVVKNRIESLCLSDLASNQCIEFAKQSSEATHAHTTIFWRFSCMKKAGWVWNLKTFSNIWFPLSVSRKYELSIVVVRKNVSKIKKIVYLLKCWIVFRWIFMKHFVFPNIKLQDRNESFVNFFFRKFFIR